MVSLQILGYKLFDITEGEIRKRLNEIRAFPRFLLIDNNTLSHSCSFSNSVSKIQSGKLYFIHNANSKFFSQNYFIVYVVVTCFFLSSYPVSSSK